MERTTERLIDDVLDCQRRILRALRGQHGPWVSVDLTMAQLKTLVVLVDEGQCPIGRIAEVLDVSLPNASHLVDKLVRVGLAQRTEDATDRRRTLASATRQGVDVLRGMREGGRDQIRAALRRVDHADLAALVRGLAALVETLEAGTHPDPSTNTKETVIS